MDGEGFLYSVTIFTFLAIFGLCYIQKKLTFFEKNKMARAANPRFPFGNMQDVVFREIPVFMQLWKFYSRFKKKKCKFGGFYVFLKPAVVVVDAELTNKALSLREWSDRRSSDFNDELGENLLQVVLRRFLNSWPSISECVVTEEANVTDVMRHYTEQVIESEFFCLETRNEKVRHAVQKELEENGFSNFFKLVNMVFNCTFSCNREYKEICKIIQNSIDGRKKHDIKKDDILQIFLDNNHSEFQIMENMFNLAHNLKISVNLVLFLLYELSLNQEIQDDLRGELKRYKKDKKINRLEDLNELNYLEAVVCETLRKYPAEPFLCKIRKKDYSRDGLSFPEDVLLFVSIFGMHHDAQNYINPELFDPDRFAEENEKFFNAKKYLPFGSKNRNHFDSRFVVLMMKLLLMDLLSLYKFSLGKKSPNSLTFDASSFRLKPKHEMWFRIEKL